MAWYEVFFQHHSMSSEPTQSCSVCFVPKKRRLRYLFRETREVLLNVEIQAESMAKRRTELSERRKDVFGVRRFDPSFQRFRERDEGAPSGCFYTGLLTTHQAG